MHVVFEVVTFQVYLFDFLKGGMKISTTFDFTESSMGKQ